LLRFALHPAARFLHQTLGGGILMMAKKEAGNGAGFYVEHFTRAELADLDQALGESLLGEIGMLRIVMRRFFERAASETDDLDRMTDVVRVLGLSITRLAKVIQTERSLQDKQADELGDALTRAMAAVLEEMGSAGMKAVEGGNGDGR
jgi:hypothetical protein